MSEPHRSIPPGKFRIVRYGHGGNRYGTVDVPDFDDVAAAWRVAGPMNEERGESADIFLVFGHHGHVVPLPATNEVEARAL